MPPGRSRKFAPKVKTGCQTCRIRRIKCDEQRPACQRCSSTGRQCDGYDQYPLASKPLGRSLTQIPDDVEERRLFHHFRTSTSSQFAGDFDSGFWSRLVLQVCHVNWSLRRAAIALASLHENFIAGSQQCTHDGASFALRQYTNALEGTRKSMADKDQPIIVTLMSCILFFCFESLRGQLVSAVMHLRSGLNILRSSSLQIDSPPIASKTVIEEDILNVFIRLGFQANYFIDKTHPINQVQVVSQLRSLSSHRLKRISTLEEAQAGLYACFNGTMFSDHAEEPMIDVDSFSTKYHMTKCARLILFGSLSEEFTKGRENAISALEEWHTSFKQFLQEQGGSLSNRDIKGSTLLKLHHMVAKLMLTTACGSLKESIHVESVMRGFKQVLEWSRFLLAAGEETLAVAIPALSPDVGIIAPMFFVATKCPDPVLRAAAKVILASGPRREGMWDADVAVKIIEDLNIQAG